MKLTLFNIIGFNVLIALPLELLADCLMVFGVVVDAVRLHESIYDVDDCHVLIIEHGELAVDERFEITLDRRDESLFPGMAEKIVLIRVHTLKGRDFYGKEARHVSLLETSRLLPKERREY